MSSPLFDGLAPLGPDDAVDDRIVRVALPIPLDQVFDYRLPATLPDALPGARVCVSFAGQPLVGLVVPTDLFAVEASTEGILAQANHMGPLADVEAVVDEEPVVSESMIRILAEEAREIFAPIGLAVAHALPPGSTPRTARPYALTPRGERMLAHGAPAAEAMGDLAGPILARLAGKPLTLAALSRAFPNAAVAKALDNLSQDGLVERRVEFRAAKARIPTDRNVLVAPGIDVEEAATTTLARATRQAGLLRTIATSPHGIATRALTANDSSVGALLRALAQRGLVVFDERPRLMATETILDGGHEVTLTDDQREALGPIRDAIKRQVPERFLLHGVTGSGKTEVYLRAIAEVLEAGRQALVLVPEITLTHQIVARVRARFGDQVAVLHSGLKPGERLAQWELLRSRQTLIAVGARSALFAPLDALGLIVIDEEHDGAYKNDEGFRGAEGE
jgi:primosomal protein N' (replication factor Y)